MWAFPVAAFAIAAVVLLIVVAVKLWSGFRRQALSFGYPSLGAYLRAAPCSDEEKRAAVSLALAGLVLCLLGLIFPPLLLIGLFPLFYGARKVAWTSMGLGLVDDTDQLA
jgi:hypothetical protein